MRINAGTDMRGHWIIVARCTGCGLAYISLVRDGAPCIECERPVTLL